MSRWFLFFSFPIGDVLLSNRAASVAILPFALFVERFIRSVPGGCSRFSGCCYLSIDLCFPSSREAGPGLSRSHPDSAVKLGS
jgi:hypothetical protein